MPDQMSDKMPNHERSDRMSKMCQKTCQKECQRIKPGRISGCVPDKMSEYISDEEYQMAYQNI